MKERGKKAVSAILATVLSMSSVITGFAGTSGSAEGSNKGGVVTSSGGDFGVNMDRGRIGIRLSLVDRANPENVISVNSKGEKMVVDCLYVTPSTYIDYVGMEGVKNGHLTNLTNDNEYSAVKTQNYTEKNIIVRIFADQIKETLIRQGFPDDIATPVPWTKYEGNAYHSKGNEFVEWLWKDQDGNVVQSNGGALATSYTTSSGTVVSVKPADPAGKMLVGEVGDTKFKAVNSSAYYSYSMLSSKLNQKGVDMLIGPVFPSLEEGYAYQKCLIGWMKEAGRITDEEGAKLVNQLTDIYNNAKSSTTSSSNKKSTFFGKLKEKFIPSSMTSYADEATSNAGGGTGTSDTGGKQVSSTAIINALLTANATNGTPLLQTPSMVASGNTDILTATEDWCLLVEPLVYLTIFESGNDRHVVLRKQYGTISNIAEAMAAKAGGKYSSSAKYGFFNWKALNGPLWGALTVSKTKDKEGNEVNGFKFGDGSILTIPTGVGNYTSFNTLAGWNRWDTKPDGHREKVGYAVNVFWRDDLTDKSEIDTWDREKYKSGYPGPAPDASDDTKYPKETEFKEQSKKFQITKWYYIEEADGTQYVLDVKTRKDTPHIVNVINEGDVNSDYFWEVEKWGTSLTTDAPADGDTSTSFEEYWKKNPGTQSGKTPAQVTIKPTDPDKSIYVKLVLKVIMGNKIDIVRVYENKDGSTTVEPELDAKVKDTVDGSSPKPGYEFKESKTTPDPIKDITSWSEVPTNGTPGTNPMIPIKDTDKTVYIRYQATDEAGQTGLVLHENEISHQFGLSDVKGTLLDGIRKYSSVSVSGSCPEIWYCSDDDCDGHRCGASYEYQNSDDWSYTIENVPSYNTQFVWKWVQTDQKSYSGNGLSESGGEGHSTPDMKMVLQRSISDKATLYPGKNGGNTQTLLDMGLQAESYKPANKRNGGTDQFNRKSWTETFNTNWQFTAHNTPTAYFETDHGYTDTDEHTNTGNESELNSNYSQSGNTLVYGLWGKANNGIASPKSDTANNSKWTINSLKFTGLKSHFKEGQMKFYPYYRMKYVSELDSAEKDVYLTSENLSTLLNIQRVDTAMFKASSGKTLDLTSTQWSIHAGAQKLIKDSADKDSLLPAGAIYTLGSAGEGSKASPIWIGYRIFNTYVPDKAVLADATGIKNRDEVINTINQFKSDTDRVVDGLEVVMYGKTGLDATSDDTKFWQNSKQITGKTGIYQLGNKFASDKKYDLKTGGTGADSSDIAILERQEEQYDWIISSDVDGNVTITRNGQELEKLTKNTKTFTNAEVKVFNDRTKLVENYISSIDRNLGSDRSGKSWYNEGFTIGCIEERYAVRVGFGDEDHNKRSAALNIKANGKLDNRQDMFNSDPEKNRSYQFFTATRSTVADAGSHQPGWIGTYDGIDIQLPNIHLLLCSKRFYTSNTTVMDLN